MYGYGLPNFAYYDHHKVCEQCQTDFVFSKEEQQHWYEDLKFYLGSYPKHCTPCRKQLRDAKARNTELGELLARRDDLSAAELDRVSELYRMRDIVDKATHFKRLAEKLRKKSGQ